MNQQIGTKQVAIGGQMVTVRIFAARQSRRNRGFNEDVAQARRLEDVRYQTSSEDLREFMENGHYES